MKDMSQEELDYSKIYILQISNEPYFLNRLYLKIRDLEFRTLHEGHTATFRYTRHDDILLMFQQIKFQKLFDIHEEICPRFLLEFYASTELIRNIDQTISLKFWALKRFFILSLESLSYTFFTPCEGDCTYSKDSSLDTLRANQ